MLCSQVMCDGQLALLPVSLLVGALRGRQCLRDWAWRVAVGIAPAVCTFIGCCPEPLARSESSPCPESQTWREKVTCLRSQS